MRKPRKKRVMVPKLRHCLMCAAAFLGGPLKQRCDACGTRCRLDRQRAYEATKRAKRPWRYAYARINAFTDKPTAAIEAELARLELTAKWTRRPLDARRVA